ncbi:uncharacterized protein CXQ87_004309 [Candidozyma duobushaemuli]|uniref:Scavenger mRNA decapping enzyme n=2 Tax=Candidozyma TaxID=3303203 RepID=A0ABX8I8F8_9ASCO|nr:uncharacterized protein CXQ87_004309 [[Candida] duobushaemulonis]PVH16757.1 hypothetical protein CXQ87_004309 [[Candida] duobushaemulonis]QWU89566.1 hypothetical protein CA3LBN_003914 [[Candida] haemuloni]
MSLQELINKFQYQETLKSDPQTKSLVLLGTIDNESAIVSLEKSAFSLDSDADVSLEKIIQDLKLIQNNDIYFWSSATLTQSIDQTPAAKVNLIYPATETHIKKYSSQKLHVVRETTEIYKEVVAPFIETQKGDRIQWVHNILFHGKESESVLYHDKDPQNGFVLLPDMKWDKISMDALYLMAIVQRTDISSVRDLNSSHIDFLKSLQERVKKLANETYGVAEDELRVFIHYQPSYYHFHIHVVRVTHPGLGDGINAGRAILLDDVIENIQLVSDYYQQRTLTYVLGENHKLWDALSKRNVT